MSAQLCSVNVVHALVPDKPGALTAIDKRPVAGRVPVHQLGVAGDEQCDKPAHGGPDKAAYAYALEDLDWWAAELGRELTPGQFGENLTTAGLDVTNAVIGERWRIGPEVVVQVTMPRIPCATFQRWIKEPHWVKRFFAHGAPGAYLRVVQEGSVEAGDDIAVLERPEHAVTIAETFELQDADPARLRLLLEGPDVAADMVSAVERALRASA